MLEEQGHERTQRRETKGLGTIEMQDEAQDKFVSGQELSGREWMIIAKGLFSAGLRGGRLKRLYLGSARPGHRRCGKRIRGMPRSGLAGLADYLIRQQVQAGPSMARTAGVKIWTTPRGPIVAALSI